jgi:hypothetical protein
MAGIPLKQFTLCPDIPRNSEIVDGNGRLKPEWRAFFDQLVLALQTTFKPEGIVFPQQTTANIAQLTAVESKSNILYDSTTNEFKGNVETAPGVYTWKTFTLV